MPASQPAADDVDTFMTSLGLRPQLPSPPDPGATLTVEEWSARLRIGVWFARRLVREAADKGQPLPDGFRVVRLGRTYRIIAA
jgi:hypothetical protein